MELLEGGKGCAALLRLHNSNFEPESLLVSVEVVGSCGVFVGVAVVRSEVCMFCVCVWKA